MALEIEKKNRENSQGLIRRFSKRVKRSGILARARKRRFKIREKSKQLRKRAALRREDAKKEYEKKKKSGLFGRYARR